MLDWKWNIKQKETHTDVSKLKITTYISTNERSDIAIELNAMQI